MIYAQAAIALGFALIVLIGAAVVIGLAVGAGVYIAKKPREPSADQVSTEPDPANESSPEQRFPKSLPKEPGAFDKAVAMGCGITALLILLIFLAYSCIDYSMT